MLGHKLAQARQPRPQTRSPLWPVGTSSTAAHFNTCAKRRFSSHHTRHRGPHVASLVHPTWPTELTLRRVSSRNTGPFWAGRLRGGLFGRPFFVALPSAATTVTARASRPVCAQRSDRQRHMMPFPEAGFRSGQGAGFLARRTRASPSRLNATWARCAEAPARLAGSVAFRGVRAIKAGPLVSRQVGLRRAR